MLTLNWGAKQIHSKHSNTGFSTYFLLEKSSAGKQWKFQNRNQKSQDKPISTKISVKVSMELLFSTEFFYAAVGAKVMANKNSMIFTPNLNVLGKKWHKRRKKNHLLANFIINWQKSNFNWKNLLNMNRFGVIDSSHADEVGEILCGIRQSLDGVSSRGDPLNPLTCLIFKKGAYQRCTIFFHHSWREFWESILFADVSLRHPLSVFRPEGSPEESKRFWWDLGSAKDLPVRFHLDSLSQWKTWPHRNDSGEILYAFGGNQWPPECHRKPRKPAETFLLKK